MRELNLNSRGWKSKDDVYDAFFKAVGAPEWHGRNFDALNDSIATGSINEIEVPYQIVIQNYLPINDEVRGFVNAFAELIHEIAARGCPVEIRIEAPESKVTARQRSQE
jgi:RNAse (barnase) inhibitor barstar